ncbi:MAG: M23 family metallopeptidase [Vicinamibacterales bacterium]|nr:M23 family metallopeptidase [Vicinamibacterales bacterium]
MRSKRYTILLADRNTGVVRRLTIGLRPAIAIVSVAMGLPMLIGLGAALKAHAEVAGLYATTSQLEFENANYRATTETLTGQIQGLQAAMDDLGARAALDPQLQVAMDKLPAIVKSRAMGGALSPGSPLAGSTTPGVNSPEDTFGLLRDLLSGLEARLRLVRNDVDRRNALAAATPSIWPVHGWLSSGVGTRADPFTGDRDYHPGLDISADRGSPVYATADGTVRHSSYQGAYGNLVIVDHGFGLETRYGHLSAFKVKAGDTVKRGDLVGLVGSTGRATGPHLHYEVRVNDRILNPLQMLLGQRRSAD